ncbi:MAG: hypothetical protein ACRD02_11480 [Acidimicrobiia bacterium]
MYGERLAQLGPKVARLDAAGGGWGAAELSPLDIAAGLAGAPQGAQITALVCYAGQWDMLPELCARVTRAVLRLGRAEGWKGLTLTRATAMASLAVRELAAPPLCGSCEGRGIQWAPEPRDCEDCGGGGSGRLAASQICEALDLEWEEWWRRWKWRYERTFSIVHGWSSEALSHLHRRLA